MPKSQGFGCMGFSAFYSSSKSTTEEQAISVFQKAVEKGVTLFNSATFYGTNSIPFQYNQLRITIFKKYITGPLNEVGFGANLRLIKSCMAGLDRSKIELMVKIGMDTRCPVEKTGKHLT
jgi:aryl-alcohol dehydrogenase-like predicted oxidoreductase